MLLYHYSNTEFKELKTLDKQGIVTNEERKKEKKDFEERCKKTGIVRPGYYFEHISFFFEPPTLGLMSTIFPPDHQVWFKGNELYQYTVESSSIKSFQYEVVEFPEKTLIFYDDSLTDEVYHRRLKKEMTLNNYIGFGNSNLEKACTKFLGATSEFFLAIKSRQNYEEIKYKYAATVPHVMLYPTRGIVEYQDVTVVKCG